MKSACGPHSKVGAVGGECASGHHEGQQRDVEHETDSHLADGSHIEGGLVQQAEKATDHPLRFGRASL